tara:strand:- start:9600 stop:10061 length:462 start_codon:yes stop_codon:yes gene_type:complete
MNNFLSWLLGTWSNKIQAQSSPLLYKQVFVRWEDDGEFLHSVHWGRKEERNPYLTTNKKLKVLSDTEVILEHWGGTYSGFTRNESCDMIMKFDGSAWMGKFDTSMDETGEVITGHAELAVFGHKLFMRDRFIDSKGNIIWGADEIYKFNRINT